MLREDNAELRVLLRALESRMAHLEGDAPAAEMPQPKPAAEAPAERDSLLHLSFDAPAAGRPAPRSDAATDPGLDLHFDDDALAAQQPGRKAG